MVKPMHTDRLGLRIRLVLDGGIAMGPGRADLLQFIQETGSIAAAGRRMRMSYKRAWQLTEDLNHAFRTPLVEAAKGGTGGGGARLTTLGVDILASYRSLEQAALSAGADALAVINAALASRSADHSLLQSETPS
ncbi:MAG: hypothetical protein B7Z78_01945 [Rhodospirillales bacterium 20-60-12]|nr:MAG: hypothetical protein B7Z78_01945 [Rhodospirillales bacterium 20-60-12]OYV58792.1 MAG: hypothetical protein B7X01_03475 [Acidiphilium sp. 21-62-4]HQT68274.1 LysR family transcriptional regulator [Acetobacteraceae bacterium]HQU00851.1 LysR family transcriptional regulator [Acetobacteraceae bacterium]